MAPGVPHRPDPTAAAMEFICARFLNKFVSALTAPDSRVPFEVSLEGMGCSIPSSESRGYSGAGEMPFAFSLSACSPPHLPSPSRSFPVCLSAKAFGFWLLAKRKGLSFLCASPECKDALCHIFPVLQSLSLCAHAPRGIIRAFLPVTPLTKSEWESSGQSSLSPP